MSVDDDIPAGPSRSRVKREVEALQKLGEQLMQLPDSQLAALPLPDSLRDAVDMARRITSRGALKRQRQYIGRLMCEIDPAPIRAKLDELLGTGRAAKARFKQTERWRERLIAEGDAALTEFLSQHPAADRQQLRQLMRAASQEAAAGLPPRHARELFRYIQSLTSESINTSSSTIGNG
ncbi:MAG: ribosome biogenesis factor YjgA [Gammaproteobacteria bacterium]